MSIGIDNIININLAVAQAAARRRNVNVIAVFTSESVAREVDSANRAKIYRRQADVENDFGTLSSTAQFTSVAFQQSPSFIGANGYLVIGYWRAGSVTVPESAGLLTGGQLSEATIVDALQGITDGSFKITIDTLAEQDNTGIDFSAISTLDDVLALLNTAVGNEATVTLVDNRFIITSETTGETSLVSFATGSTGTSIDQILKLATGTGALRTVGSAEVVLAPETKVEAASIVEGTEDFVGFGFIDNPTDDESRALAAWAQSRSAKIFADTFDNPTNLNRVVGNPVWDIRLASQTQTRMNYKKDGDRKSWLGYLARAMSVLFTGEQTTNTMNLKEIRGVIPDDLDSDEFLNAQRVGLNVYTTIKATSNNIESGSNDFTDNVYNTIALVDFVQTDLFNLLRTTTTKVPQTTSGIQTMVDTIETTLDQFIRNGMLAPGEWTLSNFFGDEDMFRTSIRERGYFVLAGSLADQSIDDREARLSPVIQIAVKLAGAVHKSNLIINVNR